MKLRELIRVLNPNVYFKVSKPDNRCGFKIMPFLEIENNLDAEIEEIRNSGDAFMIALKEEMSPAQKMFHDAFPNRKIDCTVPNYVDMKLLIEEIKKSSFLMDIKDVSYLLLKLAE